MRPATPVGGDVGGHGNDNKRPDSGWVCSFYRLLVFAAFTMRRIYLPKERQAQRPARNSTAAARDGYTRMDAWNDLQHGQPSWAPADASLRTGQYQHGPVAAQGRPVAAPNEGRRCFFLFFATARFHFFISTLCWFHSAFSAALTEYTSAGRVPLKHAAGQ